MKAGKEEVAVQDLLTARPSADKPKRLLLVGTFVSGKGFNHSVGEDLAERLRAEGWQVQATSHKLNRWERLLDMMTTTWRMRDTYDIAQVDVYSGPAFGWAEAVCWELRRIGKPYVLTLRGGNLPSFARRWPGRVRRLLGSAVGVTVPSRYLQTEMASYREDLLLLPNPLDLRRYAFRQRTSCRLHLVWLRAFHEIYNPTLAPEVVARLMPEFPDLHLTMVGPDKDGSLQKTREHAGRLGVAGHMTFPGGVPNADVPGWLQRGDIFLNTTNIDNTPVSVLEAMACGLPVVSTNVGGLAYMLENEHDALLVSPGDVEAMTGAVRRLLTQPGLASRLSTNGRAKAEMHDWDSVLPQWERLLLRTVLNHA